MLDLLPFSEKFKGEFTTNFLILRLEETGKESDGHETRGEAVADLGIGPCVFYRQGAEVDTLGFYVTAYP